MQEITSFLQNQLFAVVAAVLAAVAGYVGVKIKSVCEKTLNDTTKKNVANTVVKAIEQLYYGLDGPSKLQKAKEGILAMLNEKKIAITE